MNWFKIKAILIIFGMPILSALIGWLIYPYFGFSITRVEFAGIFTPVGLMVGRQLCLYLVDNNKL